MSNDDSTAELIRRNRAARLARGKNPDWQPPSVIDLNRARAARDESIPGTEEYAMREERLAALEDRRPRHVQRQ